MERGKSRNKVKGATARAVADLRRPRSQLRKRLLILVVSYNDEQTIVGVLDRIPRELWSTAADDCEVLIIDDRSHDDTIYVTDHYAKQNPQWKVTVLHNPVNQGYGGIQKLGFAYAIENGFDTLVLLHGDGKYAPELIDGLIGPIRDGEAEVVLGSRMLNRLAALRAGMPPVKWIANQLLTFAQNRILKSRLAEFHTGYRAYSVTALAETPFSYNSDSYDFDTDIIIQLLNNGARLVEVPIPTFHGKELSTREGAKYSVRVLKSCLLYRANRMGFYYHPKFDYGLETPTRYEGKFDFRSSHQYALDRVQPDAVVIDVGCGPGYMAQALAAKGAVTISIDKRLTPVSRKHSSRSVEADLDDYDFSDEFGRVDTILALDIIEHLRAPERFLKVVRERFSRSAPEVVITTGNVSFVLLRIGLLAGSFNYGRRGILEMDHKRLFTFSTLRQTLAMHGYQVVECEGLPVPLPLALGDNRLSRLLVEVNKAFIGLSAPLFSYQIAMVAKPAPTLKHLLADAKRQKDEKLIRRSVKAKHGLLE